MNSRLTFISLRRCLLAMGVALPLAACSTTPASTGDAAGVMQFDGRVQHIDQGCFVDGTCTATVDGIVVTTMSGERLGTPVWGQPNGLPAVGDWVSVRCARTGASSCTLKGDTGYFLRVVT